MTESFEFDLILKNRAVKISKSMIDIDEFSFVHNNKTTKNELTFDINISSKFRQKRQKNVDSTTLNRKKYEFN